MAMIGDEEYDLTATTIDGAITELLDRLNSMPGSNHDFALHQLEVEEGNRWSHIDCVSQFDINNQDLHIYFLGNTQKAHRLDSGAIVFIEPLRAEIYVYGEEV